jgi:hypothetical protein
MFPIVVSSDIIGNDTSILVNGRLLPCSDLDSNWKVGSKKEICHSLEELLLIYGFSVPPLIPEPLKKSYQLIYGDEINWINALGNQRFAQVLKSFVGQIRESISQIENQSYFQELSKTRKILTRLQTAKIDVEKYEQLLKKSDISSLKSFQPDPVGFSSLPKYTLSTSTGRLTSLSGPKILTLSQENREILKSRFVNGHVYIIDFVSLEPRVALLLSRNETPFDIYQEMGTLTSSDISRTKLKISTISTLYGSGHVEKNIRKLIHEYFRLDKLYERYLNKEKITNLFGRPLSPKEDYQKISHFVQSTAVDIALRGFETLCERETDLIPLFVIHDALVVDSPKKLNEENPIEIEIEPLGKFYLTVKSLK